MYNGLSEKTAARVDSLSEPSELSLMVSGDLGHQKRRAIGRVVVPAFKQHCRYGIKDYPLTCTVFNGVHAL